MSLVLQLLGTVQVNWDGTPLKFATEHTRALLAYLAVEADVIHRRTMLATLLWPEENEVPARHNLRQALFFLKQSLAAVPQRDTLLQVTSTTVQWHSQAVTVDLRAFQERWRLSQGHDHALLQPCAACVEHFTQAVALYQGEFLQGLLLKENYPFEEWALLLREQTHRQALAMLNALTHHYEQIGAYDRMQHYAARQVVLEPWHEESHRHLMTALAAQGQQSAALRQYENCRRILEQELGAPPSAETTRLYEQIRAGKLDKVTRRSASSAEPWQGDRATERVPSGREVTLSQGAPWAHPVTPSRRHNLPAFLPPVVGRDEQVAQLRALIDNPAERLITIVGMGGMGKTRLALALLEALATESPLPFVDGLWFVPLVSIAESTQDLAAALAEATLNVIATNVPQREDLAATLFHYLAQRQLLLVFDNLEHLLLTERSAMAISDFLLALLQAAPAVKLLTTSRIPLQLLPETVVRLAGLPVPSVGTSSQEKEAVDDAGLRLFAYHAQRVLPTFTLTPENGAAISALCRQLGGMPLAIQLAAALTPHFRVNELVTAIQQNLSLLTSKRRDLDVRHRHFGALLESTWRQLTMDEQRILAQSAIFVGHFSRAAAQAVTGASVADLSALVDKSLIQQPAVAEYQLHPLLRQFAAEQMREQFCASQGPVADQYSRYYLDFVALRSGRMAHHDLQQAIAEIQHELDNVRQAWAWTMESIRHGFTTPLRLTPDDLCRRLDTAIRPLWQFYVITCRYTEGNALWQEAVVAVQSLLAETGEREERWQQLLSKLLGLQATFLCIQGKHAQAMPIAEEARRRSLLWGSRDGEILGLNGLVHVHYSNGHYAQAKVYAEAILACVQQPAANEQPWPSEIAVSAQCMMHIYLGAIARIADDYPTATQHFTQSLQLCQSLGKLMGTMDARMNLANLARGKQNYTTARLAYEEVLAIACQLGNLRGEGLARYELGDVLRGLGDYAAALTQCTRAVALFREIDDPLLESHATSALAICYTLLGDYTTAQKFYTQALHQSESLTMPDAQSAAWLAAALFHHYTGDHQQALVYAQRSQQSAQAQQSRQGEAVALLHIAFADEELGLWTEATAAYAQAQQIYQRLDIPPSRMEAEAGLVRMALAQGEPAAALALVEKLLPILAAYPTGGLYTPFLIYLTCYHALTANADPRAAALLQEGVTILRHYANQLPDDTLRCSFLEGVVTHRALSQAYLSTNHD